LEFANKEKITEQLYPLFVHDIGALLYHPQNPNQHRGSLPNNTMAALDRTQRERRMIGTHSTAPAPLHNASMGPQMVGAPVPSPQSSVRPGLDRAHTFPTPPASASSVVGIGTQGTTYDSWNNNNGMPPAQPLAIDTGLSNQRSVPNTPASTPPGKSTQGATHYPTPQSYDASRSVYQNSTSQGPYQSSQVRFGGPLQSSPYQKSKFIRQDFGLHSVLTKFPEEEQEHEHESEYPHASNPAYSGNHSTYQYQPNSAPTVPGAEMPRVADITSPQQTNGANRDSRAAPSQAWQSAYATPQRSNTAPATNIYSVMEPRDTHMVHYQPTSYANGSVPSNKRGREDDDIEEDVKRTKTEHEEGGPVGGASPYGVNGARGSVSRAGKR
jgi:enhanced filamentous growth protein 1